MSEALHRETHTRGKGETGVLPETQWQQADPMESGIPPRGTAVVTIARQFGSGGSDIARLVAQNGGLNYVDQQIIAEVAQRLGVDMQYATDQDEQTVGMVGYILNAVKSSNPLNIHYNTTLQSRSAQTQTRDLAYFNLTQRVILELATQGNAVIVGRGSQFLLHGAPRTLHIHIFAPMPYRIENVMREFKITREKASQMIEQKDYEQGNYLRRYYGTDGHQSSLYHLLINTGLFSFERAADFICQALPAVKEIE